MIRDQIIASAVQWDQTPYHHHARVRGVGVDCAQLVVGVALDSDIIDPALPSTIPNYSVQWHLHNDEEKLVGLLEQYGCIRKDKADTKPGDIITFRFGRVTSHLGIMISETQFIHARYDVKKVVINTLSADWEKRWTFTYAFPGVND